MDKKDWILAADQNPPGFKENLGISRHVLVWDGHTRQVAYYMFETKEWIRAHGKVGDVEILKGVTHWSELLEPPKKK